MLKSSSKDVRELSVSCIFLLINQTASFLEKRVKRMRSDYFIKNARKTSKSYDFEVCGADDQSRTGDLILTKDALYLLSYISMFCVAEQLILYEVFVGLSTTFFKFS